MKNKYNIGDKVKTKIHYQNDKRKEVEAIVVGIELENETNIKYKIEFEPEEPDKKIGCTGCEGYINESDIIDLCHWTHILNGKEQMVSKLIKEEDLISFLKREFYEYDVPKELAENILVDVRNIQGIDSNEVTTFVL